MRFLVGRLLILCVCISTQLFASDIAGHLSLKSQVFTNKFGADQFGTIESAIGGKHLSDSVPHFHFNLACTGESDSEDEEEEGENELKMSPSWGGGLGQFINFNFKIYSSYSRNERDHLEAVFRPPIQAV